VPFVVSIERLAFEAKVLVTLSIVVVMSLGLIVPPLGSWKK
jgi:hypothetical protein